MILGDFSMSKSSTTWLGYLGGGGGAAVLVGGGIYQFEVWNLGGKALPTRVYVTSKKAGLIAHAGASHAMVLVTGCSSASDMNNITSSGIDWEFDIGASAKGLKGVAKFEKYKELFGAVEKLAKAGNKHVREATNWAGHEASKRLAQATMGDLGVVQGSGPQFNILPSPIAVGIGAGLFYDWQKMHVMGGKQAWSMISPKWYVTNDNGVKLHMYNVPENNGALVKLSIGVTEWGIDPYIRWKSDKGGPSVGHRDRYHINCYAYGGELYESRDAKRPGISLGKLTPIGELETGMLTVGTSKDVARNSSIKIYPIAINFGNYPYWTASDHVKVNTGSDGKLKSASSVNDIMD